MTTLNELVLKEREKIFNKYGYVSGHRYYIMANSRVPKGFTTDSYTEARKLLLLAIENFDRDAVIIDNVDFGTYPDIDRLAMRVKMQSSKKRIGKPAKRKRVSNFGEKRKGMLIPMVHTEWGRENLVFVDSENKHPDPLGKLTWGRGIDGNVYPGDYNARFKRVGSTIPFTYSIEGCRTSAQEQTCRISAIRKEIKKYVGDIVQMRKTGKGKVK
jgi:hypothetical protein